MRTRAGQMLLLLVYAKSVRDAVPGAVLKAIKEELEDDDPTAPH